MTAENESPTDKITLRERLRWLYGGNDKAAVLFRYGLLAFDLATIVFFLVITFVDPRPWIFVVDIVLGLLLTLDLAARLYASYKPVRYLLRPVTVADMIVIVSLLAPALVGNLAFFRIMRALRLMRSYHVLGELRRRSRWVRQNEDVILSTINLFVFIFFVTAVVYTTQAPHNPAIGNYIDALYFTMATLTTTGFGDVTLVGDFGRLLSVLIMIFGISLFLRLVQTVFRPAKVRFPCPTCGLTRHDPDAVHCKHCGELVTIPTEGEV
ncbi:MAG: potassium channel family protein [Geminicoccaceae bacterium]